MFDKLIVSEPDREAVRNRRNYFMVSSVVVGILFIAGVVISIYASDYGLGSGGFELAEMIAPIDLAAAAPEPPRPVQSTPSRSNSQLPTRTSNMARVDEAIAPTDISTTPNTEIARPNAPFNVRKFNSDPVASAANGREGTSSGSPAGDGLTVAESMPEPEREVVPPPIRPTVPRIVSKGVITGEAKELPKPVYSAAAQSVNAQGAVNVQVTIDESGRVISAHAVNGHILLRPAAEAAARRARFSPTFLSEVPVKVTGVIIYNFVR